MTKCISWLKELMWYWKYLLFIVAYPLVLICVWKWSGMIE